MSRDALKLHKFFHIIDFNLQCINVTPFIYLSNSCLFVLLKENNYANSFHYNTSSQCAATVYGWNTWLVPGDNLDVLPRQSGPFQH